MKLRITILKYNWWYLCQISLLIMLLPILIISHVKLPNCHGSIPRSIDRGQVKCCKWNGAVTSTHCKSIICSSNSDEYFVKKIRRMRTTCSYLLSEMPLHTLVLQQFSSFIKDRLFEKSYLPHPRRTIHSLCPTQSDWSYCYYTAWSPNCDCDMNACK